MKVNRIIILAFLLILAAGQSGVCQNQRLTDAASAFVSLLEPELKKQTVFPFDDGERFNWHYIPRSRKGASLHDLSQVQLNAALTLLKESTSVHGFKKATDVMALEDVLREVESRSKDDSYRDPKKFYFTIFGDPTSQTPWGWRLEGHHISLNFSAIKDEIHASTPSFFGSNPATIPSGSRKGEQILKQESDLGFALVNALTPAQLTKALIAEQAYSDILSGNKRKASLLSPQGIPYNELNASQKKMLMALLDVYVRNYEFGFSKKLMKKIEDAGIENLSFAWAGSLEPGAGHYYRIQGPMLLIEFDNTQNGANHIHSVVRDLTNDFAEDILREHYAKAHIKH